MTSLLCASAFLQSKADDSNHLTERDKELLIAIRSRNIGKLLPHMVKPVRLQIAYGWTDGSYDTQLKPRFSDAQFKTIGAIYTLRSGTLSKNTSNRTCQRMTTQFSQAITLTESKHNPLDHGMIVDHNPKYPQHFSRFLFFPGHFQADIQPRKGKQTLLLRMEISFNGDFFESCWHNEIP